MRDRLHMSQRAGTDLKFGRGLPVAAFHHVACRRSSQRIGPDKICLGEAGNPSHLVDERLGLGVLSELQIGIDLIVHGVQLVVEILGLLCGARSLDVRCDRFIPIADAREDVRRHVLGMGGGGRDLGVAPGGIEALLGDRG